MKKTARGLRTPLKTGYYRKAKQMRYMLSLLLFFCSVHWAFAADSARSPAPWNSPEDNGVLLHSGWQLREIPSLNYSDINTAGTTVSKAAFVPDGWMQATVPGTILACMVNNGTFPDPNYGKNMDIIRARFVNTDYVYRTQF
ncbi:MAG: hypothetical protein K9M57_09885, partial [Phycisphaerae bacterium]|nr:hypothetical protein [Phycisphaerae bacterium]